MTQYLLSVVTPTEGAQPPTPDELTAIMARVGAVQTRAREAGVWVFAGGLAAPSSATVLRPKGDDVLVVDGPFAEGKEYLGGFTVVDAPDLDGALGWARRMTEITGLPIEVRLMLGGQAGAFQLSRLLGRPKREWPRLVTRELFPSRDFMLRVDPGIGSSRARRPGRTPPRR